MFIECPWCVLFLKTRSIVYGCCGSHTCERYVLLVGVQMPLLPHLHMLHHVLHTSHHIRGYHAPGTSPSRAPPLTILGFYCARHLHTRERARGQEEEKGEGLRRDGQGGTRTGPYRRNDVTEEPNGGKGVDTKLEPTTHKHKETHISTQHKSSSTDISVQFLPASYPAQETGLIQLLVFWLSF